MKKESKFLNIVQVRIKQENPEDNPIVADLKRPCTGLVTLPSLALNVSKNIKEEDLFPTSLLHSWSKQTNIMVNLDK